LSILNCLFTGNQAINSGGAYSSGGAIDTSDGDNIKISDSQFINNSAIASGGGASGLGGALDNYGTMTIDHCLFTGNSALGSPMASGDTTLNTLGQGEGGAIFTGLGVPFPHILTLSKSIVTGNEAIGGLGGSTLTYPRTGAGIGGGIDNFGGGTLNVVGCTITGNEALGGATASGPGGLALGGGIDNNGNNQTRLNLTDSTVSSNLCQGGEGASGAAGGVAAGGGIGNDRGAIAILTNSTVSFNESMGGAGGAGANGGLAVGGGIENGIYAFAWGVADVSSLKMSGCALFGNQAQGGTAGSSAVGGDGLGGGLFAGSGTVVLETVLVSDNQSQGGADSQGNTSGNGFGGGVYVDPSASATANAQTMIASNHASKDNNDVWGTITIVP
jgi:hypothetical protein